MLEARHSLGWGNAFDRRPNSRRGLCFLILWRWHLRGQLCCCRKMYPRPALCGKLHVVYVPCPKYGTEIV